MKRMLFIVLACAIFAGCSQEAEASRRGRCDRSEASCVTCEKDGDEWGVGTDLVLYEGKDGQIINKVTGEYRFDMNNNDHKGYAVVTSKLSDIAEKIKSLFNKEE